MNDDDQETPVCGICGDRIGVHNDAALVLRGQFFMNKQDGYAMFVLDPDTKLVNLELENALGPGQPQLAIILDHNNPYPIIPVHDDCLKEQVELEEDDDDGDDDDPMDDEFHRAMERDFDPHWDDNDMLRGG